MVPVILLSDGYIANGSEPWRLPAVEELPDLRVEFRTDPEGFTPYLRDPETLARPWAIPGTPGLEHRIGGIEKAGRHRQRLLRPAEPRAHGATCGPRRWRGSPTTSPTSRSHGDPEGGKLLVVGWGRTSAPSSAAVHARARGRSGGDAARTCAT